MKSWNWIFKALIVWKWLYSYRFKQSHFLAAFLALAAFFFGAAFLTTFFGAAFFGAAFLATFFGAFLTGAERLKNRG